MPGREMDGEECSPRHPLEAVSATRMAQDCGKNICLVSRPPNCHSTQENGEVLRAQ